jgi:hypothetical protein
MPIDLEINIPYHEILNKDGNEKAIAICVLEQDGVYSPYFSPERWTKREKTIFNEDEIDDLFQYIIKKTSWDLNYFLNLYEVSSCIKKNTITIRTVISDFNEDYFGQDDQNENEKTQIKIIKKWCTNDYKFGKDNHRKIKPTNINTIFSRMEIYLKNEKLKKEILMMSKERVCTH